MYYLCVHALDDYNFMGCLQVYRINKWWKMMKIFLSTLYQMSIFRSPEIWFCDPPPHNGYVGFGDPPHKRVVEFSDPPMDLLVPPCRT